MKLLFITYKIFALVVGEGGGDDTLFVSFMYSTFRQFHRQPTEKYENFAFHFLGEIMDIYFRLCDKQVLRNSCSELVNGIISLQFTLFAKLYIINLNCFAFTFLLQLCVSATHFEAEKC